MTTRRRQAENRRRNRVMDVEQDRVLCLICGGQIRLQGAAIDIG
jgi:hypothetical protein